MPSIQWSSGTSNARPARAARRRDQSGRGPRSGIGADPEEVDRPAAAVRHRSAGRGNRTSR